MVRPGIDETSKPMEGLLPDRIEGKVRLKNGSEVDAQPAYVRWRMLEALEKVNPSDARALLSFARGDQWLLSSEAGQLLRDKQSPWFQSDGKLEPIAQSVILSAWRDTTDGPVIVNPFQLATQQDVDLLARIERQDNRFLRTLFGKGGSSSGPAIS
jgi:hypothetical protein